MHLGKTTKLLIAAATAWPLVYLFLFMGFMLFMIIRGFSGTHTQAAAPGPFILVFLLHLFTILWMFALLAFYIIYLFKTDHVAQDKKALWAVVLFCGNMIAMPVFWYLYIWREPVSTVPPRIT
ncbi:MAG TPA: hypothetical protein VLZ30_12130 [Verrucomicrobiae bacterium]|nr:hypothetical protein [Verrucomicrobiae bacterium]